MSQEQDLTRLYRVTEVRASSGITGKFIVHAKGEANTGGWQDVQLRKTNDPWTENVIVLEIVGLKPEGIVTQAIVPHTAPDFEIEAPQDANTVLVKAAQNEMRAPLPGRK